MIKCEFCNEQMKPVNHNGRGLRCTHCWEPILVLEDPPKPAAKKPAVKKKAAK